MTIKKKMTEKAKTKPQSKTTSKPQLKPKTKKKNLLAEALERKAAEQASGDKPGILGKDLSRRFSSRGDSAWKPTRPGGRNGQGKPG